METGVPEPAERRGDATAPPAERRGDATASPAERRGDATASPAAGAAAGPTAPAPGAAAGPTAPSGHAGWTASLLAERPAPDLRGDLARFGVGLGLASLYGLALGARQGGVSFAHHAAGVPAALVAVACLGVPALTIVLTLFDATLDAPRALSATARAAAATGLVLGGLAPAAALFVVTTPSGITAALMGLLGLAVGGAIGVLVLLRDLRAALQRGGGLLRLAGHGAAFLGFAGFAVALALRVWSVTLPMLNGRAQ